MRSDDNGNNKVIEETILEATLAVIATAVPLQS